MGLSGCVIEWTLLNTPLFSSKMGGVFPLAVAVLNHPFGMMVCISTNTSVMINAYFLVMPMHLYLRKQQKPACDIFTYCSSQCHTVTWHWHKLFCFQLCAWLVLAYVVKILFQAVLSSQAGGNEGMPALPSGAFFTWHFWTGGAHGVHQASSLPAVGWQGAGKFLPYPRAGRLCSLRCMSTSHGSCCGWRELWRL